ncbi:hypothetical protein NECAME_03375 [Necator americanus]|uniref:Uncharacterized protein n=1 Tax=Necator americanus TaxID=51031 RepID=W2T6B2_NECAM|nr:hypothetical protein NECAME_03375 [Necator americanus]ETN76706.1 hypothetical protein NECAME_03375 [Necator americanus]
MTAKTSTPSVKFYSRKENISIRSNRKGDLEKEMESLLGDVSEVSAKINTTTANITLLRKWVDEKKQINKTKTEQLVTIKQLIATTTKHANKVLSYYEKHDANETYMNKRKLYKEGKVDEMNRNVRDTYLSDAARERLGTALSDSVLNLSIDLRSSFAAFLHSIQLVNNLAVIFDFRLPYLLSHHEISLRERWSRELLDNDWFNFCHSVLALGLHLGMPPETLHFNCPHSNIIEQARFIMEGTPVPQPHPIIIASNRRFDVKESLPRINFDDRELISEWDTCEDLDL